MILIIFLLGLLIGSFLNVCVYRIPRDESISYPPSHCTNCKNRIKSYDLIPVISYIFLRGKCRYCGEKISIKYPIIELFTGVLFLGLYYKYGATLDLAKFLILSPYLIVIGLIDFNTTDVYFKTTLSGLLIGLAFLGVNLYKGDPISTYLIGALIGGGFIAIIILLTGGMGWGDAEICAICGIFLGVKLTILTLLTSVILGGAIGALLILTKRKTRKDYIPFGPYIVIAALISLFWGSNIIDWYLKYTFINII